jgi:hypothetical protein
MFASYGLKQLRNSRITEPEKLSVWCESPDYLVDVCAWEHAASLDIDIMNKRSSSIVFLACGPCKGQAGFTHRLESLAALLAEHMGKPVA